jgi:hypothetical protein
MTAWEILTGNSTLSSGTAWEHLNNQETGGGTVVENVILQIFEELEVEYEMGYDVEIDDSDLIAEIDDTILDVVIEEDLQ